MKRRDIMLKERESQTGETKQESRRKNGVGPRCTRIGTDHSLGLIKDL